MPGSNWTTQHVMPRLLCIYFMIIILKDCADELVDKARCLLMCPECSKETGYVVMIEVWCQSTHSYTIQIGNFTTQILCKSWHYFHILRNILFILNLYFFLEADWKENTARATGQQQQRLLFSNQDSAHRIEPFQLSPFPTGFTQAICDPDAMNR